MDELITKFEVLGLHGSRDIVVEIESDSLLLVGENGSGKTTLITTMFYFLTGQWRRLERFQFEEVAAVIGGERHSVRRDAIVSYKKRERLLSTSSPEVEYAEQRLREQGIRPTMRKIREYISSMYPEQESLFPEMKKGLGGRLRKEMRAVSTAVGGRVLFLPTYRRIEQELKAIYPELDVDEFFRRRGRLRRPEVDPAHIELVEFGMRDVASNIEDALDSLKEGVRSRLYSLMLTYLGEIVAGRYRHVDIAGIEDASDETISSVIEQIDEHLLPLPQKQELLSVVSQIRKDHHITADQKVIAHFLSKLIDLQQRQEKDESRIVQFVELCNRYLVGKQFIYDPRDFTLEIYLQEPLPDEHSTIQLRELSSGEKQIVSLFSHLLLSGAHRYYVLIDEPELSLSVEWQRSFLPDILSTQVCDGLVAVTHSPFIFENDLDRHARSIGSFVGLRRGSMG